MVVCACPLGNEYPDTLINGLGGLGNAIKDFKISFTQALKTSEYIAL